MPDNSWNDASQYVWGFKQTYTGQRWEREYKLEYKPPRCLSERIFKHGRKCRMCLAREVTAKLQAGEIHDTEGLVDFEYVTP